ncbi:hypothetical protein Tco_1296243, partial [Tanacetum coccineum]
MGWVVQSDAVLRSCVTVLGIVVTASRPLKAQFHRIFLLDSDRDCSVANRIIVPKWLTVLRRCPRGGVESSQFEALQAVLKDVMAKVLWDLLARWWESDIPVCANISKWYSWLDSLHASLKVRSFLEGVG